MSLYRSACRSFLGWEERVLVARFAQIILDTNIVIVLWCFHESLNTIENVENTRALLGQSNSGAILSVSELSCRDIGVFRTESFPQSAVPRWRIFDIILRALIVVGLVSVDKHGVGGSVAQRHPHRFIIFIPIQDGILARILRTIVFVLHKV